MNFALKYALACLLLFFGMLVCSEIGRRIGIARHARDPAGIKEGAGAAEAAVFGLLGLLIAFTFSGAASRFDDRRHLIADEANMIGTAYMRLDLLPPDAQPALRALFRRYLDARLLTYRNREDEALTQARLDMDDALQAEIWAKALAACGRPGVPNRVCMILLPSLNEMFDITTSRLAATRNHPPVVVFVLLGGLSLIGALLMGYATSSTKDRSWLHMLTFAATLSLTIYVIVDLEFPRHGLIRVDSADQILVDLKKSMR